MKKPEDKPTTEVITSDKEYWMNKWNISEEQLKEAIVRSETNKRADIEKFLINHKYI